MDDAYTTTQEKKMNEILSRATLDLKQNYTIYNNYRHMIEELELDPKEYEIAVRKLAKILKV